MKKAKIFYFTLRDEQTKEEKLDWFERTRFEDIPFDHITPDQKANWINLTDNDFDSLLPLIDKDVKAGKSQEAVFQLFSPGIKSHRDEWVYSFSKDTLIEQMKYFVEVYGERLDKNLRRDLDIKWDRELEKYLVRDIKKVFHSESIRVSLYRPYVRMQFYFDRHFNSMTYQMPNLFTEKTSKNLIINFTTGMRIPFSVLGMNCLPDLNFYSAEPAQCLPIYRYDKDGNRIDNITDWALERFCQRYLPSPPQPSSPAGEEGAGRNLERSAIEGEEGAGRNLERSAIEGEEGVGRDLECSAIEGEEGAGRNLERSAIEGEEGVGRNLERSAEARDDWDEGLVRLAGARREIPEALLRRARELRQQHTPAEKVLWECLRANRLGTSKFRRQHNIGQYIVDFYCSTARLVVELDGEVHALQKDRDGDRDAWMQANGLTVLRFNNEDVIQNTEQVLQAIASYLPSPAGEGLGERAITKLDIFHYTYAVLHHPTYRTKYELNLKREFPRLPFYTNFHQWATWGKTLMDLHLNYEAIAPYELNRVELGTKDTPKAKLKADNVNGVITLDENTELTGVPAIAWDYKLGNRSALEWILDQYKEKKPKDPTIAKLFNTYKFADYKEQVIDLLQRVCTVSVKTMEIIQQMPTE